MIIYTTIIMGRGMFVCAPWCDTMQWMNEYSHAGIAVSSALAPVCAFVCTRGQTTNMWQCLVCMNDFAFRYIRRVYYNRWKYTHASRPTPCERGSGLMSVANSNFYPEKRFPRERKKVLNALHIQKRRYSSVTVAAAAAVTVRSSIK